MVGGAPLNKELRKNFARMGLHNAGLAVHEAAKLVKATKV
jgi:hypothetical protein